MGYTTTFNGQFHLDRLPPAEVIVQLNELEGLDGREGDDVMPDGYNQWVLTKDCRHIEWDGNEKFYDYVDWPQYIIDHILSPAGLTLSGSVGYSGESVEDNGVLTIEDGVVMQREHSLLADTLENLKSFQRFVVNRYGKDILVEWKESR